MRRPSLGHPFTRTRAGAGGDRENFFFAGGGTREMVARCTPPSVAAAPASAYAPEKTDLRPAPSTHTHTTHTHTQPHRLDSTPRQDRAPRAAAAAAAAAAMPCVLVDHWRDAVGRRDRPLTPSSPPPPSSSRFPLAAPTPRPISPPLHQDRRLGSHPRCRPPPQGGNLENGGEGESSAQLRKDGRGADAVRECGDGASPLPATNRARARARVLACLLPCLRAAHTSVHVLLDQQLSMYGPKTP